MKRKYAIVDIETTGGLAKRDKITEIGIVISDGTQIIEKYESLVNPQRSIPYNITRITGIDDKMVRDAPKFFEIAKQIIEKLEDCIFIAHNVRFDYGFIREEFGQLGYNFSKKQLCTVVMTKKAFPGLRSYSLGNLIKHFDLKVNARHRALEDAIATTDIFHKILAKYNTLDASKIMLRESLKQTRLPKNLSIDKIDQLTEDCGVYYFMNSSNRVIYIGKSINIRKRVLSHFGKSNSKSSKMMEQVSDISFEITGSELIALLKEAIEIKEVNPEMNRALRKKRLSFGIYVEMDKHGYLVLRAANLNSPKLKAKKILQSFEKLFHAKRKIEQVSESFGLCLKVNNMEKSIGPCFNYNIDKCTGVCIGSEFPQNYNIRVQQAIDIFHNDFEENFFIIDKGKSDSERSIILVEEGNFKGYGYIDSNEQFDDIEEMKESLSYPSIIPVESNSIIRNFLLHNENRIEIVRF